MRSDDEFGTCAAQLQHVRSLDGRLTCADTSDMYRGSPDADRGTSRLTVDAIRADLASRRLSAEHWMRQAREATSLAKEIRDDLGQRRAAAERRRAEFMAAGVDHSIDGRRARRLAFFDADFCLVSDQVDMLSAMIDAALELTRADFGNVQLFDGVSRKLRLVAQRGFQNGFLSFFAVVNDQSSACGSAAARNEIVTVPDVGRSPIFRGGDAGGVVLDAGVRAVHSIPLTDIDGRSYGVFSVHYRRPYTPATHEQRLLRHLAGTAARRLRQS